MKWLFIPLVAVALMGAGCPKCIKSHQATRMVPGRAIYSYRTVGKSRTMYQSGFLPAHEETYAACDEYSK